MKLYQKIILLFVIYTACFSFGFFLQRQVPENIRKQVENIMA